MHADVQEGEILINIERFDALKMMFTAVKDGMN